MASLNVYVIGSLAHAKIIEEFAQGHKEKFPEDTVDCMFAVVIMKDETERCMSKQAIIQAGFEKIDWADIVYVIRNPDGSLSEGLTYERAYLHHIKKPSQDIFWEG